MKKLLLSLCLLGSSFSLLRAQQGRAEMPVDTLPIGGKQEEVGLMQMEGQDELVSTMRSLKDSVSNFLSDNKSSKGKAEVELQQTLERFSATLSELEKSEKNTAKMRLGYSQTKELRAQFYSLKAGEKTSPR